MDFALALLSTCAIALTSQPVIIICWLAIWVFTVHFGRGWRRGRPLLFWIGFNFFYPSSALAFASLQEYPVVKGTMLVLILIACVSVAFDVARRRGWLRAVTVSWTIWGLIAYLPVFLAYLLGRSGLPTPMSLSDISAPTSSLKIAVPILAAWATAVAAVRALRVPDDVGRLYRALTCGVVAVTVVALTQWAWGREWVPTDYVLLPGRLHAVSQQDPNGYGRLLLMPALLLIAFVLRGATRAWRSFVRPRMVWVGLGLAVASIGLTLSRTTFASFAVGVLVLVALNVRRKRTMFVATMLVVGATTIAYGFGIVDAFAPGRERRENANLEGRLELYRYAWNMIEQHPWVGERPGGYGAALQQSDYDGLPVSAHSMLLAIAVEWGSPMACILVVGILATVWNGWQGLRIARRLQDHEGAHVVQVVCCGSIALACAYAVHGLTEVVPADFVFFSFGLSVAARYSVAVHLRSQMSASAQSV